MSFQTRAAACAVASAVLIAPIAAGQSVIAGWSMPTAFPTGAGNVPTGTSYLPPGTNGAGVADQGANIAGSQLISVHALAAATYTSPAGNGSQFAFSSNNWSPGDYYQATLSTLGFTSISISWDQARSSTGPAAFRLLMSVDGGVNFSELMSYTVLQSGGGSAPGTWSSTTYNSIYTNPFSVSSAADNLSQVIFRFQNFEAVASSASGSNRIDNVVISGVPAPGAVALLGLAGLAARRRRR
jgi:MYXO-CTERM domain-containing protein